MRPFLLRGFGRHAASLVAFTPPFSRHAGRKWQLPPISVPIVASALAASAVCGLVSCHKHEDVALETPHVSQEAVTAAAKELRALLGNDHVSQDETDLADYGVDKYSFHGGPSPNIVVFPNSVDDVIGIAKICSKYKLPMIPYGSGTSLEGHTTTPYQGVSISMMRMNNVLEIRSGDMDVTVQPGIRWEELNAVLKPHGLFFPMDPGPGASIGGMVGTGCSGTNAVRYGTMKQNVLNVKAVLADGSVVTTARRARKSVAGYDLTSLFVGSEGTLGIVVEATLKLVPIPEQSAVAVCSFETLHDASSAVRAIIQRGIQVNCVELLDDVMIDTVNKYANYTFPAKPHIFFKFSGTADQVAHDAAAVEAIAMMHKGGGFKWSSDAEERDKLWSARKAALFAAMFVQPDRKVLTTDVCVPISKFPDAISDTKADILATGLFAPIVGHIGDGNYHVIIMFDPDSPQETSAAQGLNVRMVKRAIALQGTCTGEHGVGQGKAAFLEEELGSGTLNMMRTIKTAVDPHNLMNPGKLIPGPDSGHHATITPSTLSSQYCCGSH